MLLRETEGADDPASFTVGSSMSEGRAHPREQRRIQRFTVEVPCAGDSAAECAALDCRGKRARSVDFRGRTDRIATPRAARYHPEGRVR